MIQYIKESYEELTNHVTWPTISDAQREMVVVVVFSILFSLVIWGMDSSFEYLIGKYYEIKTARMSGLIEKKWYVIKTVTGQENKIKNYIENETSRLGYSDYVEEVLVPTEKVVQVRNGKKTTKDRVHMPGYVMVKVHLAGEVVHIIKSIPGVVGFLSETKGGDPLPLRKADVSRMLGQVDELAETVETVAIPFEVGEMVKLIDGPFNGFNATIERVNEEKRKLEVMVKIFGRKTPLELSYTQVEKL